MKRMSIVGTMVSLLLLSIMYTACGGGGSDDSKILKLFGTTTGHIDLGVSILVQLNPNNGAFMNTIGPVGYYVNGLEYDPGSDKLYGTTSTNDPTFADGLIEINMGTGAGVPIGPAGLKINNPTVNSSGEMFGWTEDYDWLISVDQSTGAASTVGDSAIETLGYGLAFDNDDNLYLVNASGFDSTAGASIYTIDTGTGLATFTSTIPALAHHGDFHPKTGLYWGIDQLYAGKGTVNPPDRNLLVINVDTPEILNSLPTVDNLHAITFFYDTATELVSNGSFETGDLGGWEVVDAGAGMFGVVDTPNVPGITPTLAGPSDGDWYVVSTQGDPTTTGLFHFFTVPMGEDDIRLTFDMFVFDNSGVGPINAGVLDHTGATNQHARVDILSDAAGPFDTGGTVVRSLYLDVDGDTAVLPYKSYSFNLSGDLTPGESYVLRFALSVTEAPIYMGIDDVSIRSK